MQKVKVSIMLRVDINDIDTSEDSIFIGAIYQGIPFTGVAYEETEKSYFECPFLEGNAEGRCFERLENGTLIDEALFHNGIEVEERSWFSDGQLSRVYIAEPKFVQEFRADGKKRYEYVKGVARYWYKNGMLREELDFNTLRGKYYSVNGQWLFDMKLDELGFFVTSRSNYVFNNEYIQSHAIELLNDQDFYKHFLNWLPEYREGYDGYVAPVVLEETQKQIIIEMIESDNSRVQFEGICLADNFHLVEAISAIRKAAKCNIVPSDILDEDGICIQSSTRSIAQQAKLALKRLSSKAK